MSCPFIIENLLNMKKKKVEMIIVIEPDVQVVRYAMERWSFKHLLDDARVDFLFGVPAERIQPNLMNMLSSPSYAGFVKSSRAKAPEYLIDHFAYPLKQQARYQDAVNYVKKCKEIVEQLFISFGCASDSHYRWENTVKSLRNVRDYYEIKHLFDKFKGVPAVIVGGGPSAEDFFKLAEEDPSIFKKSLVIACDAVLPRMLGKGFKPHIVLRCERKKTDIMAGVDKSKTKGIFFAGFPWVDTHFFEMFDESFMLFRGNGIAGWAEPYEPGQVNGGVSSANCCVELAYLLGCSQIITTGIDLAFIGGKSHVDGTKVEFSINKSKKKWTTVKSNDGKELTTIPVWKRCLNEYEMTIWKYKDTGQRFINTSLEGAKIEGADVLGWDEVKPMLSADAYIPQKIKKHLKKGEVDVVTGEKGEKTLEFLKKVQARLYKDFTGPNATIKDQLLTSWREATKLTEQCSHLTQDPVDFYKSLGALAGGLEECYSAPWNTCQEFMDDYYEDVLFNHIFMDMCRRDVEDTNNALASFENNEQVSWVRSLKRCARIVCLFKIFYFYTERLIEIMEGGDSVESDSRAMSESLRRLEALGEYGFQSGVLGSLGSKDPDLFC